MPTYEYRCPQGHEFEKFQRMSDPPAADCPECGRAAERILSGGAGFLFKGDGFYITDYRSDSYRKAAEKDRGGGEGGKGKEGDKAGGAKDGGAGKAEAPKSGGSDASSSSSKPGKDGT